MVFLYILSCIFTILLLIRCKMSQSRPMAHLGIFMQTCQVSRILHETHAFEVNLTLSRWGLEISRTAEWLWQYF